jgi:hypothetical protein
MNPNCISVVRGIVNTVHYCKALKGRYLFQVTQGHCFALGFSSSSRIWPIGLYTYSSATEQRIVVVISL